MSKKRITKKSKQIYFITQKNNNNICLSIRVKYLQKIPIKYGTIKRNIKFSTLYTKQLFQQKALRTYYGYIGKRFLKMLYLKAKKYNLRNSSVLKQWISLKLDHFLVKIRFFKSIAHARQSIAHGKIQINKRIIKNNAYVISVQDIIERIRTDKIISQNFDMVLPMRYIYYDNISGYRFIQISMFKLYQNIKKMYTKFKLESI